MFFLHKRSNFLKKSLELNYRSNISASVAPGRVSMQVYEFRISRAEEQAAHDSKEGRVLRRQIQKNALNHLDKSFLLYGPGIDDSV